MPETEVLFSINSLPDDKETLKEIRNRINAKLGEATVNIYEEIVENIEIARHLRNKLCGIRTDGSEEASYYGEEETDYSGEEIKDSDKIKVIATFTTLMTTMVKLRETVYSQEANYALQEAVVEVLGEFDPTIKTKVVELFKEKIAELERKRN